MGFSGLRRTQVQVHPGRELQGAVREWQQAEGREGFLGRCLPHGRPSVVVLGQHKKPHHSPSSMGLLNPPAQKLSTSCLLGPQCWQEPALNPPVGGRVHTR